MSMGRKEAMAAAALMHQICRNPAERNVDDLADAADRPLWHAKALPQRRIHRRKTGV